VSIRRNTDPQATQARTGFVGVLHFEPGKPPCGHACVDRIGGCAIARVCIGFPGKMASASNIGESPRWHHVAAPLALPASLIRFAVAERCPPETYRSCKLACHLPNDVRNPHLLKFAKVEVILLKKFSETLCLVYLAALASALPELASSRRTLGRRIQAAG
jgi:hypothetical protein